MAVLWIRQSLKKLNEKTREQQAAKEEISEIQDAVIELAGLVSELIDSKEGEYDG